jgi:abortive infection bacteriophage resistance protein
MMVTADGVKLNTCEKSKDANQETNLRKKKLSIDELIQHMKDKGITFHIVNEAEARHFLQEHNYYFKLAAYRGNYVKNQYGPNAGKYDRLDFVYLEELSKIDMELRYLIMHMCLDIEHQIKVMLMDRIEKNPEEDGYGIVREFDKEEQCRQKILKQSKNSYAHELIEKYHDNLDFPIWALCELISFGELCRLYKQYTEMYPECGLPKRSLLNPIRNLRNAAAHSNCLIYKLKTTKGQTMNETNNIVAEIHTISRSARKKYLRIRPIHDFAVLLYWYHNFVKSEPLQQKRNLELHRLFEQRMLRHSDYFYENHYIKHAYIFTLKLVKYFFPSIDN